MVERCITNSFDCPNLILSKFISSTWKPDQSVRTGLTAPGMNMSLCLLFISGHKGAKRRTSWLLQAFSLYAGIYCISDWLLLRCQETSLLFYFIFWCVMFTVTNREQQEPATLVQWLIFHFSRSVILSTNWTIFERCLNENGWKSNNTTVSWTSMQQSDTKIEREFHWGVVFPSLPIWAGACEYQWVLQVI